MSAPKLLAMVVLYVFAVASPLLAHCEVPCGIYTDEARFVALEEDLKTIERAMGQEVQEREHCNFGASPHLCCNGSKLSPH